MAKKRASAKQIAHRRKFGRAAKSCAKKTKTKSQRNACMRKALSKGKSPRRKRKR